MKTYLVQTWNKDGALQNHYEVVLAGGTRELRELRNFLQSKYPHVVITSVRARALTARKR